MKSIVPFFRILLADFFKRPNYPLQYFKAYAQKRSFSVSSGSLPVRDIFELIPSAASLPITLQGIFEAPDFPVGFENESARYTASTKLPESCILALLTKHSQAKKIIEVGTSFGESTLLFALNSPPEAEILTLDIQSENPTVGSRFRGSPLSEKISQSFQQLSEVAPGLEKQSYDLIFIDGDHGYDGVVKDSLNALDLIRPDGFICWHDYTFRCRSGVVRALDYLQKRGNIEIFKIAHCNLAIGRLLPASKPV